MFPAHSAQVRRRLAILGCVLFLPGLAAAQSAPTPRADSLFSTAYVRQLWNDTQSIVASPLHWDHSDWEIAGIWTGATLTAASLDRNIRHQVDARYQTAGENNFFRNWEKLGSQYSWVEIAAFEGYGVIDHDQRARDTAMDSVSASIIAGGIIAPVLKLVAGRYRPSQTRQTFHFRPFSLHQSFPSGHTVQAFAIATVIASHYRAWWEQALAYGSASLVGVARIQQNAHFTSDVVAGAAIGWAVARAVVHRHTLPDGYTLAPWVGNGAGLLVTKQF